MGVLALFVAFGRIYNRTPARLLGNLVLEARTLTIILVAFALLADLFRGRLARAGRATWWPCWPATSSAGAGVRGWASCGSGCASASRAGASTWSRAAGRKIAAPAT